MSCLNEQLADLTQQLEEEKEGSGALQVGAWCMCAWGEGGGAQAGQ